MAQQYLDIRTVAVIGAGISGVAAAIHLRRVGLDVTVFERNRRAGGIWVYDDQIAKDAAYPSELPSVGDSPEYSAALIRFKRNDRRDSPMVDETSADQHANIDVATSFAPPGPCYIALKNNVSTIEMELSCQQWRPGTGEFVPHHVLADYIQDSAEANGVMDCISLNTRVNRVRKLGKAWEVEIAELNEQGDSLEVTESTRSFDALVIATGHYHACNIPDIPGLSDWKRKFPNAVNHSKLYRRPEAFKDKNVLLIGAGVSSIDIARDLGPVARSVYQSSRGGTYDIPSHLLCENSARVGAIESFDVLSSSEPAQDGTIPGYHVSFPFMRHLHADSVRPEDADEEVLVTNGQVTHNLHKDIWYIPDPTLAFIGVPYHVATFSFFEFQAMALAAVFAGGVPLPLEREMRAEYVERIKRKGPGRTFHSLKNPGDEIAYVDELVKMTTAHGAAMSGHTKTWHEAYARRCIRHKALFGKARDPHLDQRVMDLVVGC